MHPKISIYFNFLLYAVLFFSSICFSYGQSDGCIITGRVTNSKTGKPVEFAVINIHGTNIATQSKEDGTFALEVNCGEPIKLDIFRMDYKNAPISLDPLDKNQVKSIEIKLSQDENIMSEVIITDHAIADKTMIREGVTEMKFLPSASGNIESLLPHIALGTSSGTGGELTSQYNVRGGNYDENLIYINDFEIYRPQLIRSGQQEGLSFPNIDLIKELNFSSGGFGARFGDKMSSVLDIKYKLPTKTAGSIGMSLLGGSAHLEGSFKLGKDHYRKARYLIGARYKTTKYLLGTTNIKGEYQPEFFDFQSYLTFDLTRTLQLGLLANYNLAKYGLVPQSGVSAKGVVDFGIRLRTDFEGQEVDEFYTNLGGLSLTYLPSRPKNPFFIKLLSSIYRSSEYERFDLIGNYSLYEIDTGLGSENGGGDLNLLGGGTQQRFARNYLNALVYNTELKGGFEFGNDSNQLKNHFLHWGLKFQHEYINDKINEWERLDSAGFSLPFDTAIFKVFKTTKAINTLNSNRLTAFLQHGMLYQMNNKDRIEITVGLRFNYWTLNNEYFVAPRIQLVYTPLSFSKNMGFKLAGGLYYQPAFYRELRDSLGVLNKALSAQKSAQYVLGWNYDFGQGYKGRKKYKFILEGYYKQLWDLVPYDVDNVRIRYSGKNEATGYAVGLDMRLNGEFVPDAESWFNFSLLQTKEAITGITHLKREPYKTEAKEVKNVPRPTEQYATLAVFFQDYLPQNKNFKMHMGLTLGTGLPYGIPDNNRIFRNTYRFNPYHRIDIGFSVTLFDQKWKESRPNHLLRFTKKTWLSLEVFNLLKIQNAASNTWIKDIFNISYAIPNYLSSRRINLRIKMEF